MLAKLQVAQKQDELEKLHFEYIKLEKQNCALKLETASLMARLDS